MSNKNTKSFGSRWGFILASVGSAVGMANVWGFPNKLGSNGGGAFLLIYLLLSLYSAMWHFRPNLQSDEEPEQEHLVLINMHGKQEVKSRYCRWTAWLASTCRLLMYRHRLCDHCFLYFKSLPRFSDRNFNA